MAFPTKITLHESISIGKSKAVDIRAQATALHALSLAGPIAANQVLDFHTRLCNAIASLDALSAMAGINAYAKVQFDDPVLVITETYVTMRAAMTATRNWLIANIPQNVVALTTAGYTWTTYPTSATAGLRTQLSALIATIADPSA